MEIAKRSPSVAAPQSRTTSQPPSSSVPARLSSAGPLAHHGSSPYQAGSSLPIPTIPQQAQEFRPYSPVTATMQGSVSGGSYQQQVNPIFHSPALGQNNVFRSHLSNVPEGQGFTTSMASGPTPSSAGSNNLMSTTGYPIVTDPTPQSTDGTRYSQNQPTLQQQMAHAFLPGQQVQSGQSLQHTPINLPPSNPHPSYQTMQQGFLQPIDQYIPPTHFTSQTTISPMQQAQTSNGVAQSSPFQTTNSTGPVVDIPVASSTYPPQPYETVSRVDRQQEQQYHVALARQQQNRSQTASAPASDVNHANESTEQPVVVEGASGDVVMEDQGQAGDAGFTG